jgi:hypothetical protein
MRMNLFSKSASNIFQVPTGPVWMSDRQFFFKLKFVFELIFSQNTVLSYYTNKVAKRVNFTK